MLKICPICGQTFEPHHYKEKYCSPACKREGHLGRMREVNNNKPKNRKQSTTLTEKNAQARSMGLTYGQMQAIKYAQEHRLEV